ncbi:glucose 1-dehydrogenase [Ensifer adhaerens]|uniref:SDR family NAD(P)-dependent oxidoreductase n=1 Tax=Ensifer adhaerens TaxID=106592 RepID=UPI001CBCDE2B|nr:glucose 1-dehydrogenase [Ensifer adhaerens]MBZ7924778.1 glucose 1-dehydrogenase [Ensifer adhaerens]UAX96000.1 glucose 1-dehydrogenase [Ensifer adhaerens]UAY04659.1 glucose 1-dehydrogenase [Ensifer adhaerens]UAY10090.1 glucose 1-dehydrogenase [Ensifer adhaerens]
MRLANKVAIVTGGTRGIGSAIAERFVEEGAVVISADLIAEEKMNGDGIVSQRHDVSNQASWRTLVSQTLAPFGRIDILVNNAGMISHNTVESETLESWQREIDVNQTAVWLGMREVVPAMRENGSGSIVNVSSIWGLVAVPSAIAYHASKAAVVNMSRCAAVSFAKDRIRVNSLHPGLTLTEMVAAQAAEITQRVVAMTPLGRGCDPREIANGALFLASDEASFITGTSLIVDGGYTAQ